jgi:hypothetical protein
MTIGFTDETAINTAASNDGDAVAPVRRSLTTDLGSGRRNDIGKRNEQSKRSQPRTGLVANPAQRTRPFKLGGSVAAYWIASGVENDSAMSTNGSEGGVAECTRGINSG